MARDSAGVESVRLLLRAPQTPVLICCLITSYCMRFFKSSDRLQNVYNLRRLHSQDSFCRCDIPLDMERVCVDFLTCNWSTGTPRSSSNSTTFPAVSSSLVSLVPEWFYQPAYDAADVSTAAERLNQRCFADSRFLGQP